MPLPNAPLALPRVPITATSRATSAPPSCTTAMPPSPLSSTITRSIVPVLPASRSTPRPARPSTSLDVCGTWSSRASRRAARPSTATLAPAPETRTPRSVSEPSAAIPSRSGLSTERSRSVSARPSRTPTTCVAPPPARCVSVTRALHAPRISTSTLGETTPS
jgi:hypothetical protein